MEFIKVLQELSRRKKLVGLVLVVSFLIGFLLAFRPGLPPKSRQYQVSLASSDVLVDTRDSQVVAVRGGPGSDLTTLTSRANLIGNLTTSGSLKDRIAKSAGVPSEELIIVPPGNPSTPGVPVAPVTPPGARGVADVDATKLSFAIDESLPILHLTAQAPNRETALKLSGAVIVALKGYLGSVAASQDIPAAHRLVVRQFGAPVAGTATRGLPRRFALATTIILALLGCGAIVAGSWFIRSWKQIEEAESRGIPSGDGPPADHATVTAFPPDQPHGSVSETSESSPPPLLEIRR